MKLLSLVCVVAVSGCAGLVAGNKQNITVVTPGVEGASCSLTDSKGRVWYVASTPGSAIVKKGDAPISVICKKEGYETSTGEIHDSLTPSSYGNLALLPLAPVGYFLDSVSGSSMKYDSKVEVEMEELSADKIIKKSFDE